MEKKWVELTPEEKREVRFKKWLAAEDVEFASPEAEKAYKERVTRLSKALLLQEPDRVPVMLPSGYFPAFYAGGNLHKVMYDYDELRRAWLKFLHDFDMDTYRGPNLVHSGKVLEILDYKLYKWPGYGLAPDVSSYQFIEGEYMMADEYDELIKDPSDFALRVIMPRTIGAFAPFKKLPRFATLTGMPIRFVAAAMNPDVRAAFQAFIDAGEEMEKWQRAVDDCNREGLRLGFPSMRGGMGVAPFDSIADSLRGTRGAVMDMFRQPDKLHKAMDRIADLTIENAISTANDASGIMVSFPLHKGDDTFMSDEQFETFYWPSLKKVILALIEEGLMVMLFAEGRYQLRLKTIKDLPRGWTMWQFDQTDMASAKEILGDIACIAGNIPSSLVCTGTPERIKEYCRNLIETCGKGGGYILTGGASATEAPAENLHVIMEAAKEYGVYK